MAFVKIARRNHPLNKTIMALSFEHSEQLGVQVFSLSGRLMEKRQAEGLIGAIQDSCNEEKNRIVLGLNDLEYMNSSGLNVVLGLFTTARNAGGELAIGGISDKVEQLLVMTKLNSVFKIYDTINTACEAVSDQ